MAIEIKRHIILEDGTELEIKPETIIEVYNEWPPKPIDWKEVLRPAIEAIRNEAKKNPRHF